MGPLAYGNAVVIVYLLKFLASDIKKVLYFAKIIKIIVKNSNNH